MSIYTEKETIIIHVSFFSTNFLRCLYNVAALAVEVMLSEFKDHVKENVGPDKTPFFHNFPGSVSQFCNLLLQCK